MVDNHCIAYTEKWPRFKTLISSAFYSINDVGSDAPSPPSTHTHTRMHTHTLSLSHSTVCVCACLSFSAFPLAR